MGNVTYVDFGSDRSYEGVKRAITAHLTDTLTSCAPGRIDRAEAISQNTVELMRKLEPLLTFPLSPSIRVPTGCTEAAARSLVDEVMAQLTPQVMARITDLKNMAHAAIAAAALTAVADVLCDPD